MKKILVVILAMVMVIGMATSAYAFTDTDNLSTVEQDSIYRLYALGVLNGYPDGSFGAANNITRAEFAKIACIISGMGNVSDVLKSTPSSFSDVTANQWYTGYINVAASKGFVHGYPNGTFKPNSNITMAEVITILMRIAGYNDNLPGPWPFDYISEAGKQDVTDDVTFVSNVAATRGDVAIMSNNALDMVLVNWTSDLSKFVKDSDGTTMIADSFNASVDEDVVFDNDSEMDDALDGWYYSKFSKDEIKLKYDGKSMLMNENCYISDGKSLTDLGGMQADLIINDDDEVIYIKLTSSVEYSDDVEGSISNDNLKINDESVEVDDDFAPWFGSAFNKSDSGYAKIFYNDDGDVYAVSDLRDADQFGSRVMLVDSYDTKDEELTALDGGSLDLEDMDYILLKDGEMIDIEDLDQMDVVYILEPKTGADYVLLVTDVTDGSLDEGSDNTITLDDKDYDFNIFKASYYNDEGGIDGNYYALDSLDDLEDIFGNDVSLVLYRNNIDVAYLIAENNQASSRIYGVVTDISRSGLFNKIDTVTILNQSGKEVSYDVDNSDNIMTYDAGKSSDIELGAYVEVKLDKDGEISSVDQIIMAASVGSLSDITMNVSGSKIKINGTWYKVTGDTLFFETVTDGEGYLSLNFDEANLIDVDDILNADSINADGVIIASKDGGTLERLFIVDSNLSSGNDNYSFVDRLYTNSLGDFVKMMDGTVAERKSGQTYNKNVFYAYYTSNGELVVSKIFATDDANTTMLDGSPYKDGYWVSSDGYLGEDGHDYALGNLDNVISTYKDNTLTLAGHYYTITSDTQIFTIDSSKVADVGDKNDIKSGKSVLAISDEDGNLLYVFVLAAPIADPVG